MGSRHPGPVSLYRERKFVKEDAIDFVSGNWLQAELELFKHVEELLSINQFDRRNAVAQCLSASLGGERTGRQDDSFVGSPLHRSSEVSDLTGRDRLRVALALKRNLERHQRIHL